MIHAQDTHRLIGYNVLLVFTHSDTQRQTSLGMGTYRGWSMTSDLYAFKFHFDGWSYEITRTELSKYSLRAL